ncbi:MAG: metalloregulator ArsR/SmtB family transcription factor [Actinomycetota bacterium]|nr:metalloregulator ArsR/SmtB family transcription factor [Actinomycetota bacterium]
MSPLEDALRAIAHPGRRAMLELVWDRERPATELADGAGLSPSAASQHLKLLRDAGLVRVRVDANRRLYRADVERVAEVAARLDEFWASPLARLKAAAEAEAPAPGADDEATAGADDAGEAHR